MPMSDFRPAGGHVRKSTVPPPSVRPSRDPVAAATPCPLQAGRVRYHGPQRRVHHHPPGHPADGRRPRGNGPRSCPGWTRWAMREAESQYSRPAERRRPDPGRYRRGAQISAHGRQADGQSGGRGDRSGRGHQGRVLSRSSRSYLGDVGQERPAAVSERDLLRRAPPNGTSGWIPTISPHAAGFAPVRQGAQRDLGAVRERAVMLKAGRRDRHGPARPRDARPHARTSVVRGRRAATGC